MGAFWAEWGTAFQGITAALIATLGGLGIWYIRGWPDRRRAETESDVARASIEEVLRGEAAEQFKQFRNEVHELRNELATVQGELRNAITKSTRRGDKLNMLLFILRLVMDELSAQDPKNKVLAQARTLLTRVEDEPHEAGNSAALERAEEAVEATQATVREVKATEAKAAPA